MWVWPGSFGTWCRETQLTWNRLKTLSNRVVSVRGQRSLWRELCPHLSLCALLGIFAGWQGTATPGDTTVPPCRHCLSPESRLDHLHSELIWPWNGTVHLSNHLKQNHFYDHFLWFVKIVYGSLLPTHCCSYLKTYLDGILQSLLKFAWIILLIFYCSTWIKWQAEMLIRLKFPSAMQVPLMFQLALEWNKITSTVLVLISLNKQEKFSRINSLNCTFRVHFINLQR